jgi:hypothetical protein
MISPRMRFPEQWLDYVEENIDTWRKEWVEWFCDVRYFLIVCFLKLRARARRAKFFC